MGTTTGFWFRTALLVAVLNSALPQTTPRYFAVGDNLTLDLKHSASEPIVNILWKYNNDFLAEWIHGIVNLTYYDIFKGRTTLDTTTGHLTIENMKKTDNGIYSMEVNGNIQKERYDVKVIEKVPQPDIWIQPVACSLAMDSCTLSCEGKTTEAEPVTYSWKQGDGQWENAEKDINISKVETGRVETFSCLLTNPVSQKESKPKPNPLFQKKAPHSPVGVVLGVIFGLAFLAAIVVAVIKRAFILSKISQLPCFHAAVDSGSDDRQPPADKPELKRLNASNDGNPPEETAPHGPA